MKTLNALIVVSWACVVAALAAPPGAPALPKAVALPQTDITGYLWAAPNKWAFVNNTPKSFDLVDDIKQPWRGVHLAFADEAMYREAEKFAGAAVRMRAVQATRGDDVWYVVVGLEVLP